MSYGPTDVQQRLSALRSALENLQSAKGERGRLEELGKAVDKKVHCVIESGEPYDSNTINEVIDSASEEAEIRRIHDKERSASVAVQDARTALHSSLDAFRSERTRDLFAALDSILAYPRVELTARYLGIAELILAASSRRSARGTVKTDELEDVKILIRQLHSEGASHAQICDRLAAYSRPSRAKWSALDWPMAFKKDKQSVSSWISKVIHSSAEPRPITQIAHFQSNKVSLTIASISH
jgi:hypothetical protein